jgi:hypothetical protein
VSFKSQFEKNYTAIKNNAAAKTACGKWAANYVNGKTMDEKFKDSCKCLVGFDQETARERMSCDLQDPSSPPKRSRRCDMTGIQAIAPKMAGLAGQPPTGALLTELCDAFKALSGDSCKQLMGAEAAAQMEQSMSMFAAFCANPSATSQIIEAGQALEKKR